MRIHDFTIPFSSVNYNPPGFHISCATNKHDNHVVLVGDDDP